MQKLGIYHMGIIWICCGYPVVMDAEWKLNGRQLLREGMLTVGTRGAWYPSEGVQTGKNLHEICMKVRSNITNRGMIIESLNACR